MDCISRTNTIRSFTGGTNWRLGKAGESRTATQNTGRPTTGHPPRGSCDIGGTTEGAQVFRDISMRNCRATRGNTEYTASQRAFKLTQPFTLPFRALPFAASFSLGWWEMVVGLKGKQMVFTIVLFEPWKKRFVRTSARSQSPIFIRDWCC